MQLYAREMGNAILAMPNVHVPAIPNFFTDGAWEGGEAYKTHKRTTLYLVRCADCTTPYIVRRTDCKLTN